MKKQLGTLASLLFLGASVLFWSGCSSNGMGDCGRPICEKPCAEVCGEPACETECHSAIKCCYPCNNELRCIDGIRVKARNPKMCMLGDQYSVDFDVEACDDICEAEVTTHIPEGVTYVRSEPQAKVEGRRLVWEFGSMRKGECRSAKVWVECECEGELCVCFCARATPVRFCSLICAKPMLTCQKCGPEEVCPGDPIHYTITVTNRGTCTAEDVVVTDNVPAGLEHSSGLRTLTYKLGCLKPCESKKVNICLTANTRGEVCNTAVVSACNADSVSCQWCTCVCCAACEVAKIGPKEVQIGKNAEYQITVTNTGDKPLTDVIVTDTAPNATSIVSANGAMINGNQAVWRLREMKPGEKVNFNITLTTCTPGCFTNRVTVHSCQGTTCCDDFVTRWRGRPALNVCICDTEDPVCVGDPTSYCITVVNQGSEPDDNVRVVVRFPPELVPVGANGDTPGNVKGNIVTFAPYDNFGPRQTLKYRVDARANRPGDGRVIVEVTSESITTPIVQQESTIVQ
jgi:uncharacterized repeat protein (TIGR01451 family)